MTQTRIPTVLFVCLSNAGRSVMAQGLMHHTARKRINATSASTRAKTAVNELSAQVLAELGINILDHQPPNSPPHSSTMQTSSSSSEPKPTSISPPRTRPSNLGHRRTIGP
jgi:arsenate-mycothiol transferase